MRAGWRLVTLAAGLGSAARIYLPDALGGGPAPWWLELVGGVCFPLAVGLVVWADRRHRRAGREATRVQRLWDGVRQTSRDVVWELTAAGTVTYVNDATVELLGAPAETFVGREVFAVVHPEDAARARAVFTECAAKGVGWSQVQLRVVLPDGRARWVASSGAPSRDAARRLVGFTATTRRLDADDAAHALRRVKRARIETILRHRALSIEWQPIFALGDRRVAGVEALSRIRADVAAGPEQWFDDAHEVGLGVELELLALETALEQAAALEPAWFLSLNASPATVTSGRLLPLLRRHPRLLPRVVLELTEHALIEDYEGILAPLSRLRASGVRLAVDDAGAGFASFRHVLQLQPDIVKLDRSITHGLADNPAQRALAAAVVMFAIEVGGMTVTAEGVETAADLAAATLLGIDNAQGFVLARPAPATQVVSLLETASTGAGPRATVGLPT